MEPKFSLIVANNTNILKETKAYLFNTILKNKLLVSGCYLMISILNKDWFRNPFASGFYFLSSFLSSFYFLYPPWLMIARERLAVLCWSPGPSYLHVTVRGYYKLFIWFTACCLSTVGFLCLLQVLPRVGLHYTNRTSAPTNYAS